MVDAAYFAMTFLNYTNIAIVVTSLDGHQKVPPDTTVENANTYNSKQSDQACVE